MNIEIHHINNEQIAEVVSDKIILAKLEDALDLLGNLYYQGFDKILIHEENIIAEFFDLKSRLAGEILQKFSTYGLRLAIVGDFSKYASKSLKDFIYESNKGKQVCFVNSVSEGINKLLQ